MSHEVNYEELCRIVNAAFGYASLSVALVFHEIDSAGKNIDFEKLYHMSMKELEDVIRTLISAQQKCEDLYLQYTE